MDNEESHVHHSTLVVSACATVISSWHISCLSWSALVSYYHERRSAYTTPTHRPSSSAVVQLRKCLGNDFNDLGRKNIVIVVGGSAAQPQLLNFFRTHYERRANYQLLHMLLKRHTVDQKEGSACCVLSTEAIFGRKYERLLKKMDLVIDDCENHRLRLWFVDWREGRLGWCLVQSSFTLSYRTQSVRFRRVGNRYRLALASISAHNQWIRGVCVRWSHDTSLSEGHMTLQVCPRVIWYSICTCLMLDIWTMMPSMIGPLTLATCPSQSQESKL